MTAIELLRDFPVLEHAKDGSFDTDDLLVWLDEVHGWKKQVDFLLRAVDLGLPEPVKL